MKKLIALTILTFFTCFIKAQDPAPLEYLGLPGDNLNLYAVMNLFQGSETLEAFERGLNDKELKINNLDLNGDNFVDYIKVIEYSEKDIHTIVLQVALNEKEKQDVAVFTVQRFENGSVEIQLIGDEILYGENYIIEPIYDGKKAERPNPGYTGKKAKKNKKARRAASPDYGIEDWPIIVYIYEPDYSVWHSSWSWGYFPEYWSPWSPSYYHYYYGYHQNYYPEYYRHYRHWQYPRCHYYSDIYHSGMRSYSSQVSSSIGAGTYKTTYSHPEQRKNGEELYNQTRSRRGEVNRRTETGATVSPSRRTGGSTTTRTNTTERQNTGTSRRTTAGESTGNDPVQAPDTRRPVTNSGTGTDEVRNRRTQNQGRTDETPAADRRASQPERREVQPEQQPERQPERQLSEPERRPTQTERQSQRPAYQPERQAEPERRNPEKQAERPSPKPERQTEPERRYTQPERQPERPSYQPQRQAEPERRYAQPERPAFQPERQVSQPERTYSQPERQEPARRVEAAPAQPAPAPAQAPAQTPSSAPARSSQSDNERPVKPARQ